MKSINKHEVELDDESVIRVVDMLSAPKSTPAQEVSYNVFRFDNDNRMVWRIQADVGTQDRNPFVGLTIQEDGQLVAFRWDGGAYAIDVDTGKATYSYFAK
ncbi:MAG: hypothetical protein WD845_05285 [Pirellulales bacterium]